MTPVFDLCGLKLQRKKTKQSYTFLSVRPLSLVKVTDGRSFREDRIYRLFDLIFL